MRGVSSKLTATVVGVLSALFMAFAFTPAASAQIIAPPAPPIHFDTYAVTSALTINGEATTVVTVAPGAAVTFVTTTADTRPPSGAPCSTCRWASLAPPAPAAACCTAP